MKRIQINLGDELAERMDVICDRLGVTRSAFCVMKLSEAIDMEEQKSDLFKAFQESMTKILSDKADLLMPEKK